MQGPGQHSISALWEMWGENAGEVAGKPWQLSCSPTFQTSLNGHRSSGGGQLRVEELGSLLRATSPATLHSPFDSIPKPTRKNQNSPCAKVKTMLEPSEERRETRKKTDWGSEKHRETKQNQRVKIRTRTPPRAKTQKCAGPLSGSLPCMILSSPRQLHFET